jgi:hypothetical protein
VAVAVAVAVIVAATVVATATATATATGLVRHPRRPLAPPGEIAKTSFHWFRCLLLFCSIN